jgi:hypothetical protein
VGAGKPPTSTMSHPSHRVRVRPPVSSGKLCGGWQTADIYYVSSKPPGSCTPPGELRKTMWRLANRRHLLSMSHPNHRLQSDELRKTKCRLLSIQKRPHDQVRRSVVSGAVPIWVSPRALMPDGTVLLHKAQ